MKRLLTGLVLLITTLNLAAQEKEHKEKTGFSFGAFPIVAYDSYTGVQLGALANIYDFGKGGWYPNPRQQMYMEASWFTKGSQLYVLSYDNRFLIPGIRFSFAAQFSNDQALDFYGFNGFKSYFDPNLPAAYYKMSRKYPYGKIDFTGRITDHFFWKFGYHFKYFILDEFQNDALSSVPYGKSLFSWYKDLGFIEADEYKGGMTSAWRAGLMWDSRDVENAPSRGIWTEAFIEWAPKWMGTNKPYGHWYFVFRNYLPIVGEKLVFAYRANVQGFIGKPAFYVLPFESMLGPGYDRDGFGGYRTIRGVMRNRIQGKTICYFNTEFRWRFVEFTVLKQNLTLGANVFFDGGRVLQDYTDITVDPELWKPRGGVGATAPYIPDQLLQNNPEKFHLAAGGGLRFILNKNFIIAVDYGRAFNRQDNGKGGSIYVNTGYLF